MRMVISIGSNVQFSEKRIKFEVMILEDIPNKEFYSQKLRVSLLGFIRPEAYFPEFSSFIHAMENDIWIAKESLHEHSSINGQKL